MISSYHFRPGDLVTCIYEGMDLWPLPIDNLNNADAHLLNMLKPVDNISQHDVCILLYVAPGNNEYDSTLVLTPRRKIGWHRQMYFKKIT